MGSTEEAAQITRHEPMELDKGPSRRIEKADQCFLMYFIMGVYFGPDLKNQPRKSVLQRTFQGFLPYTSDQLSGSHIRIEELEQIYCSILRKADKSIGVNLPVFHEFLRGKYPKLDEEDTSTYLQFPDLFPAPLHRFSESADGNTIIENIVFIEKPETFYLKPDEVERFRRLTGQEDFCIRSKLRNSLPVRALETRTMNEVKSDVEQRKSPKDIVYYTRKRRLDGMLCENEETVSVTPTGKESKNTLSNGSANTLSNGSPNKTNNRLALTPYEENSKPEPVGGPAIVVLPSQPSPEELNGIVARSKFGYALTGSAVKGQVGPVIGLMDIGEAHDSYLFRVALPGVKKEGGAFRCEVESDGKVLIKGETVTGENTVLRYTQEFEMQTHNLCPPGPFSISFRLPGPVDHRQFTGSFGSDGVLEGIVMKAGKFAATG